MENIINSITSWFTAELAVFIVSCLPLIELRGSIPIGMALGMSVQQSFIISYLGSILPIAVIYFTIKPIFKFLKTTKLFKGWVEKLTAKTLAKGEKVKERGLFWGLLIFVAIPLPGTGIWSGSLIAVLLDMSFKKTFLAVAVGNLIAGIIVLTISYGAFSIFA